MRVEHWVYTVPLRLRSLLRRRQVERELDEELRYHLERQVEEYVARGMSANEARTLALRAMGGVERQRQHLRAEPRRLLHERRDECIVRTQRQRSEHDYSGGRQHQALQHSIGLTLDEVERA